MSQHTGPDVADPDAVGPDHLDDADGAGWVPEDGGPAPETPSLTDGPLGDTSADGWSVPVEPDGWLTLDDGTHLQLVDSDGDGAADVTVQAADDGWIIGREGADGPRFEHYGADGSFLGVVDGEGQLDTGPVEGQDPFPDGPETVEGQDPFPDGPETVEGQDPFPDGPETVEGQDPFPYPEPVLPEPVQPELSFSVDGTTHTATPDLDLDQDGTPESFSTTDAEGHRVVLTDSDGDGVADRAFVQTDEGAITMRFDGTTWVADESSYEPVDGVDVPDGGDGTQGGGVLTVPEQFRQQVDPSAPWQVRVMQDAMDNYGLAVAELWRTAYPGEPWPSDDETGEPYHPDVLARMVANDADLSPQLRTMGTEFVDHWTRLGKQAVGSEPALSVLQSAAQDYDQPPPPGPVVTLADGTVLELLDSDLDGDADVLVRQYADRYVVVHGADTTTPLVLTYALDGTLLDTSLEVDGLDGEPLWEGQQPVEPVAPTDPMDAEVAEDAAFWFLQEGPTCALTSLTQVVEDFLGTDVDIDEVKAYALSMGWYEEGTGIAGSGGTDWDKVPLVLEHFGVPAQLTSLPPTSALDQIDTWAEQGTAVIAWVDASAYWAEELWPDSRGQAAHAVRVLDVDEERGVVVVNDTALPDGARFEVPVESFDAAMARGGYSVVTSLGVDPDGVGALAGTGPLAESGFVLLPLAVTESPAWSAYLASLAE